MTRADIETTRLQVEQLALRAKDARIILKRHEDVDQQISPHRAMAIFFLANAIEALDLACAELTLVRTHV
jgi:hypothetical protein